MILKELISKLTAARTSTMYIWIIESKKNKSILIEQRIEKGWEKKDALLITTNYSKKKPEAHPRQQIEHPHTATNIP